MNERIQESLNYCGNKANNKGLLKNRFDVHHLLNGSSIFKVIFFDYYVGRIATND